MAGVTHGTHLFNGMPPLLPGDPVWWGPCLQDEGVSVALIVDGFTSIRRRSVWSEP